MADTLSKQPRLSNTRELASVIWTVWEDLTTGANEVPPWGSVGRTAKLREAWRTEPILAGAVASMVQKATSLDWQITGGRNRVSRYREILAEADDGAGWSFFLTRYLQDYLTTDVGGVAELGREGKRGPVAAIFNADAQRITLTGSRTIPVRYTPDVSTGMAGSGTSIPWGPLDFSRIVDMPSPDEARFGLGFCAVSRALKAAKVLMALYNYEDERLRDMPLPGIVSITGMTQAEVKAAFQMYEARRQAREQTTFKGVLWLAAQSSPINPIEVDFKSFAGLPEGFNREQVITQYVFMLALDFGVDVREFWPASQTGATKAEAEVQAQKAKGKGFGEMISTVERAINWDVLPEGLEFLFDQKDSEDDLLRETVHAQAIANVRTLWEPAGQGTEGIISTEEARRWLVEIDAAPDWLSETDQTTAQGAANTDEATDVGITEKARRADLDPGEDFVAVNSAGDVVTLWSSRRVFMVADWPIDVKRENVKRENVKDGEAAKAGRPFLLALKARDPRDRERRRWEGLLAAALYGYWGRQFGLVKAELERQRLELLAAQWEQGSPLSGIFVRGTGIKVDWGAEEALLLAALGPLLGEMLRAGGEAAIAETAALAQEIMGVALSWELWDMQAARFAETYQYTLIRDLTQSTRDQLGQVISKWIQSPEDFEDLVARVRKVIPPNPYPVHRDRARLVAQTETTRVYAESRQAALRALGLRRWVWQTADDELVCPVCRPLHLQEGSLEEGWVHPETGMVVKKPPAHPGCRCWTVAAGEELEQGSKGAPDRGSSSGEQGSGGDRWVTSYWCT